MAMESYRATSEAVPPSSRSEMAEVPFAGSADADAPQPDPSAARSPLGSGEAAVAEGAEGGRSPGGRRGPGRARSPDPVEAVLRRCTKCGAVKPLGEFGPELRSRRGRRRQCRDCHNEYQRVWRAKNRENVRATGRRYYEGHRAEMLARARGPDARWRRDLSQFVLLAVRFGVIPQKHACEHCGVSDRAAALVRHHPAYERPLDVVWLCTECHGAVHQKAQGGGGGELSGVAY